MKLNNLIATLLLCSALEAYTIQVAPKLRPAGGVRNLGFWIFLLNVAFYAFWRILVYPFFVSPLRHIPGPKNGNLILGHAVQARFKQPRGDRARQWMEDIPNEGLLRFRDLFNQEAIIPTSHAMLKTVLNDNSYDYIKQPNVVETLRTVLGDGLILVEGDVHKFQRKHLLPSFQTKLIKGLYPTFWNKACELTRMLGDHAHKPEIEMGEWCTRVTLDIIGIAGFGRDFNALTNPNDEFVSNFQEVLEPTREKAFFFLLSLVFGHWLVSRIPFWYIPRQLNKISASLYQFGYNLSRKRRAHLSDPKLSESEREQYNDILSHLVASNDFSDHELAHQVLTMLAAGHETTSSTLTWCLFLLAQNPQIQSSLRTEIRTHLSSPNLTPASNTIDASTLDTLPLLNAVCAETLRLYPTVPVTTRAVARPTQLSAYTLPIGTTIYIIPWATNRLTSLWGPDACTFNPSRWLDIAIDPATKQEIVTVNNHGNAIKSSNYSLLTFLHGPRSCIGQGFAKAELKCLLAALVGRYEFEASRDVDRYYPAGIVTNKAAEGMWLRVKEVEGW